MAWNTHLLRTGVAVIAAVPLLALTGCATEPELQSLVPSYCEELDGHLDAVDTMTGELSARSEAGEVLTAAEQSTLRAELADLFSAVSGTAFLFRVHLNSLGGEAEVAVSDVETLETAAADLRRHYDEAAGADPSDAIFRYTTSAVQVVQQCRDAGIEMAPIGR